MCERTGVGFAVKTFQIGGNLDSETDSRPIISRQNASAVAKNAPYWATTLYRKICATYHRKSGSIRPSQFFPRTTLNGRPKRARMPGYRLTVPDRPIGCWSTCTRGVPPHVQNCPPNFIENKTKTG